MEIAGTVPVHAKLEPRMPVPVPARLPRTLIACATALLLQGLEAPLQVAWGADVAEAAAAAPLQDVIVTSTPIPGRSISADEVPGAVQTLSAGDLIRQGSASLTTALESTLSSVSVNDNLGDPFQPDILYRGFEASPVLGTPEGLAVYENGVRINEAFGDTVDWDLLPDVAVDSVELVSSSPLYGLNALGGAISVTMKNGFTYQGGDLALAAGSYGNRSAVGQFGTHSGSVGIYVAGKVLDSTGWRDSSSDTIRSLFASSSLHTDRLTLDLSVTHADNDLHGQSATPVQELAVARSLTFTGPQANVNILNFFTLNGTLRLTDGWSMQGVAYYRAFFQSVSNGNTTNYVACDSPAGALCQPDGVTPLTDIAGDPLPDISRNGTVPIGENDFELIHAWGRGVTLQIADKGALFGHDNQFAAGAALDYASTSFFTDAQIGAFDAQRNVLPSELIVYTPESSAAAVANGDPTPVSVDAVNKNLGAFVTDTFDVARGLSVTASGRYNIAHVNLVDQLGPKLTGFNRFVHFNPAIGATYRVIPSMTLYGGYSVNTRTPTASEIECSDPLTPCLLPTSLSGDPPNLRQVIARTSELGLRGKDPEILGGAAAVIWNLDVFRTVLHDDIQGISTSLSQGFFQNIGDTRRQGIEAGLSFLTDRWTAFLNYSFVQAAYASAFLVPSAFNPHADADGNIQIEPGDRFPGIPEHRVKLGVDYKVVGAWTIGATVNVVSGAYYNGDQANLLEPIPGYTVAELHSTYRPLPHLELFASITNLFDRRYATYGLLSDPTGVGAPGIPPGAVTNGPGVDNRFLTPAAPFELSAGVRLML
ncbi:MAG: TonB-dependent receptor [Steroidobacteraceae bacterium]